MIKSRFRLGTEDEYAAIREAGKRVVGQRSNDAIALSYEYDQEQNAPDISADRIRSNGVGDDGCETLGVYPASNQDYCKTALSPYDAAVVAVLLACADYCPAFSWSSDGSPEEHADGEEH